MALDFLGVKYSYGKLLKLLNIREGGTAAANIRRLEAIGVRVL